MRSGTAQKSLVWEVIGASEIRLKGTNVPIRQRGVHPYGAGMADEGPHAVLPPDEATWHLVRAPLSPRTSCGLALKYGAKLRAWTETPADDRCEACVRLAGAVVGE